MRQIGVVLTAKGLICRNCGDIVSVKDKVCKCCGAELVGRPTEADIVKQEGRW